MAAKLDRDETKRQINLRTNGLDFVFAGEVLDSRYRLDIPVVRAQESRTLPISYVMGFLSVLTVVHVARNATVRIVSFRCASRDEREAYFVWINTPFDEP